MDLKGRVRQELYALFPEDERSQRSELAGILRFGGVLLHSGKGDYLSFTHKDLALVKKTIGLKKYLFSGLQHQLSLVERTGIQEGRFFQVDFPLAGFSLPSLGFVERFDEWLCFHDSASFFRGAFEAKGYVGNPHRGYQLELTVPMESMAKAMVSSLAKEGLSFRIRFHGGDWSIYTKNASIVSGFLQLVGASGSYLDLEKLMVEKSTFNNITRWVNCETGNLQKTVDTSLRQRKKIARINLDSLSPRLREVAALRLQYPHASLREIGLLCNPELSKAEVHRKLRHLEKIADQQGVDRE